MPVCNDESPLGIFNMVGKYAIPQGADWSIGIVYKQADVPVDFSGATALMQIRKDYDQDIILELSTTDGSITLGTGAGNTPNVILNFKHMATSNMSNYYGIYDLEVTTPSGTVYKFLEGKFELRREITK